MSKKLKFYKKCGNKSSSKICLDWFHGSLKISKTTINLNDEDAKQAMNLNQSIKFNLHKRFKLNIITWTINIKKSIWL